MSQQARPTTEQRAGAAAAAMTDFKPRHVGNDAEVLRSREIRKRGPPFAFLWHPVKRLPFATDLTSSATG